MIGPRWRRRLVRAALAFAAGGLVALISGWLWLRTSLPPMWGAVAVPGLSQQVDILFDEFAVPTIRAADERDAAFALGYLHAQNRLFQMEFMRRIASGRLSEILGARGLATDRYMRVFDFVGAADADFERLTTGPRAVLEAYSRGVNAYLETRRGAWPPEFYLLRMRPEPWQPRDSLLWGRLMALQLSTNWSDEWLRARLAQKLSPLQLESLWPATEPALAGAWSPDPAASSRAAWNGSPVSSLPAGASNSWAVAGALTDTGSPYLASDPHLGLGLPIQWYLARIETPGLVLAGATAPGLPFLVLGRNDRVAWSFTTTVADNQDLFIEQLAAGQPDFYLTPEGPRPFAKRTETFRLRGGGEQSAVYRSTHHGPVISDVGRAEGLAGENQAVALAWACMMPGDRTVEALYRMNHARDAGALRAALVLFDCPVQNLVYADRERIGFIAAGRIPTRKAIFAGSQMPVPGADGAHDWTGFLSDGDLPQITDPADGILATANNDIRPEGYAGFIAGRFDAPYRVDRIREALGLLRTQGPITLEAMAALQMDTLSPAARSLLPRLLELVAAAGTDDHPLAGEAIALLRLWNFRVDRERPEPLIFNAWLARLNQALFADELGDLFADYDWWNAATIQRLLSDPRPESRAWCDDVVTPAAEDCPTTVKAALIAALDQLADSYGGNPARWRWGDAHRARFSHQLFGRLGPLDWLTRRDLPTDGDNYTLDRAVPRLEASSVEFPDIHGAGFRGVYDLANPDNSRFSLAGGQSGNPLSPHYADLLERWRDGASITIVGDKSGGSLRLLPELAVGKPPP